MPVLDSVGCIELSSIAVGYQVADAMKKSANIDLIWNQIHCPGRLMLMVLGDSSSVAAAIETGIAIGGERMVDSLVLSRIHPDVLSAIKRRKSVQSIDTLAVIEAYSISSAIKMADLVVKSHHVKILEVNVVMGLAGKGIILIGGDMSSVSSAAEIARSRAEVKGKLVLTTVIANPDPELLTRGRSVPV